MSVYSRQRGNILFLILLAVVLFAALSYAVTSNERGQVKSAAAESLQTAAAQIVQYATLMENTVNRLKLINGCSDTDISFSVTTNADPTGKKCWVYHAAGGGMAQWTKLDDKFLAANEWSGTNPTVDGWYGPYKGTILLNSNSNVYAPDGYDLTIFIPFISKALCEEIQMSVNGTKNPFINQNISYPGVAGWNGTYGGYGLPTNEAAPYRSGCVYKSNNNYYAYYHVLIAR